MQEQACAKINLGLDVVGKREDGYHLLRSVMQTLDLCDTLELTERERDPKCGSEPDIRLSVVLESDPYAVVPVDETNLAWRAAAMLMRTFSVPRGLTMRLTKRIPVAAGMAGGSTDAAAALRGVNRLFSLGCSTEELKSYAVRLGADVPYCVEGGTVLCEGIGEILTTLPPLPDCVILIAKPGVSISTPFVYKNLKLSECHEHPDMDGMIRAIEGKDIDGVFVRLGNLLETAAIPAFPVVDEVKKTMKELGASEVLMSGSGPTVFGRFPNETKAAEAGEELKKRGLAAQTAVTHPICPAYGAVDGRA